jgi:glycosyltransferase involved in cell wall biosynthesis
MKVLIVQDSMASIGGVEKVGEFIAEKLRERGHQVFFLTYDYDKTRTFTTFAKYPKYLLSDFHKGTNFFSNRIRTMGKAMRGFFLGVFYGFRIREHFDFIFLNSWFNLGIFYKLFFRAPIGAYIHHPEITHHFSSSPIRRAYAWIYVGLFEQLSLRVMDYPYCNSSYTQSITYQIHKVKPRVISPFPLDTSIDKTKLYPQKEKILISINRIAPFKRLKFAVEVFSKVVKVFPDYTLVLAGYLHKFHQDYYESLVDYIKSLGLQEKVKFVLNAPSEYVNDLNAKSELLLYTSLKEHCGNTPFASGSLQTPCIVNKSGGLYESIIQGKTGYALPYNSDIWADCIINLLKNPEKIHQMSIAARIHILRHFTYENQMKIIIDDIEKAGNH